MRFIFNVASIVKILFQIGSSCLRYGSFKELEHDRDTSQIFLLIDLCRSGHNTLEYHCVRPEGNKTTLSGPCFDRGAI